MKKYSFEMVSKLDDNTPVVVDEFKVGADIYTIDEAGVKAPLFDGDHKLIDGTEFVSVAGKITEIKDSNEDMTSEVPVEVKAEVVEVKMVTQESFDELVSKFDELSKKFDELNSQKLSEVEPKSVLSKVSEPVKLSRRGHILEMVEKFNAK